MARKYSLSRKSFEASMKFSGRVLRRLMQLRSSSKGGAALELAVVFPILLLLLIGVGDFGRVYFASVTVANAARAGAEYGARRFDTVLDTAGMRAYAQADGNEAGTLTFSPLPRSYCECNGSAHACTACSSGAAPDVFVEVTASKTVPFLLRYPGLPSSITITRKATFRSQ